MAAVVLAPATALAQANPAAPQQPVDAPAEPAPPPEAAEPAPAPEPPPAPETAPAPISSQATSPASDASAQGNAAGIAPAKTNPEAPLDNEPVPVKGKWSPVLYGFVQADFIHDSTQSFAEQAANGAIARPNSYQGDHGRTMFGVRNSRLGFKLSAPEMSGITATGILEMDFLGNQPPNASEQAFFTNPTFRVRHYAMKLQSEYVDVLVGQYWQLFGWQSYFHPNTVEIQGVPGQVYSRAPQLRVSHTFKTDPVNVELALAAARPPQRDSEYPDGQGGLKFVLNHWKGLHTGGATGTAIDGLGVGVSGVARRFRVPEVAPTLGRSQGETGWGVSVDALIPVIPATDKDRANALTLTGSFVTGTGISDLYSGLNGGLSMPTTATVTNADGTTTTSPYAAGIDNGLAMFNAKGELRTIDWQSFMVGVQYYLPPSGKVWISANYSHMKSGNAADFTTASTRSKVFDKSDWVDGNLCWDPLPAVRFGLEYAYFRQKYVDTKTAENHRVQLSGFYLF